MIEKCKRNFITVLLTLLMVFGMAACVAETPTGETVQPAETVETPPPEEATASPSPTPSPDLPVVLLAVGPEADPWQVGRAQGVLEELIAESSLGLVVQEGLEVGPLAPNVRMLVGINLSLDPAALAGVNPATTFVFIDQEGAVPLSNLSVIGEATLDQQYQTFMAGYLAALVSSDYKVAGLIPAGQALSDLMIDAFVVGAEFFCGVCNPLYPPFENFPQWETLSPETANGGFEPVMENLAIKGVEVLYIQRQLASPAMLTYLADKAVKIVGDGTPDAVRNNWVGTVTSDPGPALMQLWPDLMAGMGGAQIPSAIALKDTEAGNISEGRLRMFEEMAEALEAGLVSPQTTP